MPESQRDEDFDLDDIKIHSAEVVDRPLQASPYAKPAEIIIEAQAWRQMNQHAREDLRNEVGGIMLGGLYENEGAMVVRVTTAVAARGAVNSMASLEFTYEAWSHMEKERQHRAPEEKLIGWYHTHPGFSAFFSSTDRFMHENFFPQPWHVALVIDPVNDEHRFYRWDNGRLQECTEFLLQVDQWPGPEPPLNAVLSTALRRSARQLEVQTGSKLGPALKRLVQSLRHSSSSKPLEDLLPFLLACSELEPEALVEARQRLQEETPPGSPLRLSELDPLTQNHYPPGAISIADGWLAQQIDEPGVLHLHDLADSTFCRFVRLPFPIHDLAIDENGRLLALSREAERPLYRIEPSLPRLRSSLRYSDGRRESFAMIPAEIDWKGQAPPRVGKILAGRRAVYLLTRSEVLVLAEGKPGQRPSYELTGTHSAASCGWESFAELVGWTMDPTGDLYILRADTREVWRLDQIAGRWTSFLNDKELGDPRSLAASQSALSIYDAGQRCVAQYGITDGRLLCRRPLDEELKKQRVWHLFGDAYRRLYLVTDRFIYQV